MVDQAAAPETSAPATRSRRPAAGRRKVPWGGNASRWWMLLPLLAIGTGLTLAAIAIAQAARETEPAAPEEASRPLLERLTALAPSDDLPFRFADEAQAAAAKAAAPIADGTAEARLIGIYRLIGAGRLDEALTAARRLATDEPKFRLAHLVLGDLLAAQAAPLRSFGGRTAEGDGPELGTLAGFQQEAKLRLLALAERPEPGTLPSEVLMLPPSTPYVVAVDTSRARMYLIRNQPAAQGGPKIIADFYTSIGKQGIDKRVEGDQRTPLGVYYTTGRIDRRLLEDRFGVGALPLNYPNALDRMQGRTGSGILVHGVSSDTYSRPPLDSDGCVVVSNDDLLRLAALLPERDTPVIISQRLQWAKPAEVRESTQPFQALLKQWEAARHANDPAALTRFYLNESESPAGARAATPAAVKVDEFSVFSWAEGKGTMVVTYREKTLTKPERERWMRQYWKAADGGWRIVIESPVRSSRG